MLRKKHVGKVLSIILVMFTISIIPPLLKGLQKEVVPLKSSALRGMSVPWAPPPK